MTVCPFLPLLTIAPALSAAAFNPPSYPTVLPLTAPTPKHYPRAITLSPFNAPVTQLQKLTEQRSISALCTSTTATTSSNPTARRTVGPPILRILSLCLICTTIHRRLLVPPPTCLSLSTAAVSIATAAITWIDFAPTASIQHRDSSLALSLLGDDDESSDENPNKKKEGDEKKARKFHGLVRLKTAGEIVGLSGMVLAPGWTCVGAASIIVSHLLFWFLGAGACRVDSWGNVDPVPAKLVRVIATADAVVLLSALVGAFGWNEIVRTGGKNLYSILVGMVCLEKLSGKMKRQMKEVKAEVEKDVDPKEDDTLGSLGPSSSGTSLEVRRRLRRSLGVRWAAPLPDPVTRRQGASSRSVGWPEKYDWEENWYPMAFEKVTDKTTPNRLELLGSHLVLWYNSQTQSWSALADECPHRLAPLSEGRIDEEGQIECPYHGWTFTESGTCTKIPQAEGGGGESMRRGCSARSYRVLVRQGIIWVWGKVGATAEEVDEGTVPICPPLDDERFVWIDFSRDLPYSADILLENVLDTSHVPFTHHNSISKRENGRPLPLRLTTPVTAGGFEGQMEKDVATAKQGEANLKAGRTTERTTRFVAPTYMQHRIRSCDNDGDYDANFETLTVAYATPTGPGRSRLLARFPFRFPPPKRKFMPNIPPMIITNLPDWINHVSQLRITDDDNIFLPLQERHTADRGGWKRYAMPTDADAYVRAYRRWCDSAGPAPHAPHAVDVHSTASMDQLLDRKVQHTDHCASCRGALRNAGRVKRLLNVVLVGCAAVVPSLAFRRAWKLLLALVGTMGVLSQVRRGAVYVETSLTTGVEDYPPPRNRL